MIAAAAPASSAAAPPPPPLVASSVTEGAATAAVSGNGTRRWPKRKGEHIEELQQESVEGTPISRVTSTEWSCEAYGKRVKLRSAANQQQPQQVNGIPPDGTADLSLPPNFYPRSSSTALLSQAGRDLIAVHCAVAASSTSQQLVSVEFTAAAGDAAAGARSVRSADYAPMDGVDDELLSVLSLSRDGDSSSAPSAAASTTAATSSTLSG
jgi:hypothetical protein